jgi:F-type H+-transporting ATPase subunit gamma
MPNLRDIKRRIGSVKNTQKITQAMQLVSAAKVKKAETLVKAGRPYSHEILRAFQKLLSTGFELNSPNLVFEKSIDNYPKLLKTRPIKTVGLLVVTSNRGLAGAFNANTVKKAVLRVKELNNQGIEAKLFIVGTKGINALRREELDIADSYPKLSPIPTVGSANVIAEDMADFYVREEIDSVEIITTAFKSLISYEVQNWRVLPVDIPQEIKMAEEGIHHPEMIFEPNCEEILKKIVPLYISNRVYQALAESYASELSARMNAMANATKNAGEMIQYLTLLYNKARQSSITQELLEVVSGANALSKK